MCEKGFIVPMSFRNSKVAIVGIGNVGATTAYSIINQGLCEEVILIDVNKDKAYAEALDMQHSVYFLNRNINVRAGDYADCGDADIVVITASAPMPKDSHDRMEMLRPSINIMKSIVGSVMASGFNGIFLVVSNPVDIMTYLVWRISRLPASQVIGSGTTLDTARLCCSLARLYDLDAKSVETLILGEHGDSEMVAWSSATIGGKLLSDVMQDNADRTRDETRDSLLKQTKEAGWQIFSRKGNTSYGIAASNTAIIKSILFNENRILPVSVFVSGKYGINGLYLSVPTILNAHGAKETVEIRLAEDELAALQASARTLEAVYKELDI